MELAYAGLHQLCAPLLDLRERLPDPQRDALATAFGLSAAPPPDRFVVGLAVLGLLSEVAEEQPLLCVVDDAQWLDPASALTLAFVARRLLDGSVGLVFAVREPSEVRGVGRASRSSLLGGLRRRAMPARCSTRRSPGRLDERCATASSPSRAATRWPCSSCREDLTPAELAGGFGLPDATPVANRIEQSFLRQARVRSRTRLDGCC